MAQAIRTARCLSLQSCQQVLCLLSLPFCFGCPGMSDSTDSITLRKAKSLTCSLPKKILNVQVWQIVIALADSQRVSCYIFFSFSFLKIDGCLTECWVTKRLPGSPSHLLPITQVRKTGEWVAASPRNYGQLVKDRQPGHTVRGSLGGLLRSPN